MLKDQQMCGLCGNIQSTKRMPYHLAKCKQNHRHEKWWTTCPFNASHIVDKEEYRRHVAGCQDRLLISKSLGHANQLEPKADDEIVFKGNTKVPKYNRDRPIWAEGDDENWDDDEPVQPLAEYVPSKPSSEMRLPNQLPETLQKSIIYNAKDSYSNEEDGRNHWQPGVAPPKTSQNRKPVGLTHQGHSGHKDAEVPGNSWKQAEIKSSISPQKHPGHHRYGHHHGDRAPEMSGNPEQSADAGDKNNNSLGKKQDSLDWTIARDITEDGFQVDIYGDGFPDEQQQEGSRRGTSHSKTTSLKNQDIPWHDESTTTTDTETSSSQGTLGHTPVHKIPYHLIGARPKVGRWYENPHSMDDSNKRRGRGRARMFELLGLGMNEERAGPGRGHVKTNLEHSGDQTGTRQAAKKNRQERRVETETNRGEVMTNKREENFQHTVATKSDLYSGKDIRSVEEETPNKHSLDGPKEICTNSKISGHRGHGREKTGMDGQTNVKTSSGSKLALISTSKPQSEDATYLFGRGRGNGKAAIPSLAKEGVPDVGKTNKGKGRIAANIFDSQQVKPLSQEEAAEMLIKLSMGRGARRKCERKY